MQASYQGEDEDYIDDHYIGFVTMNPLATTNTSDLRHRTIDLLDVFRRRAELEALVSARLIKTDRCKELEPLKYRFSINLRDCLKQIILYLIHLKKCQFFIN
jgi:hypothetical protein